MNDDAFKSVLELYEKLAEKCPEKIDDILPEINELIASKSQYDADIVKKKYDTEIVEKECEEKTKRAIANSELNQKFCDMYFQLQMQSLIRSSPENKPSQDPRTPKPEMSGESESTRTTH